MAAGCSIQVTETWLRTARKPTKTPADKTTAFSTGTRDKKDRINTKEGTTTTNKDLIGGREEGIKGVLAVGEEKRVELGGGKRRRG